MPKSTREKRQKRLEKNHKKLESEFDNETKSDYNALSNRLALVRLELRAKEAGLTIAQYIALGGE